MLFMPCGTNCRISRVLSLNAKLELSWYFVLFEFCEMRSKFTITILNNRARVHNTYMRFLLRTKVSIQIKETAVADSLINYRAYLCSIYLIVCRYIYIYISKLYGNISNLL